MIEWTEDDWVKFDSLHAGMTIRAVRFAHWGNFKIIKDRGRFYMENLTNRVLAKKHAGEDGIMRGWVVVK